MTRLPSFLIIGAAKSGTTSLAEYLSQHPDVYFSPYKEPNYFALAGTQLPLPGPASPEVLLSLLYSHSVTDFEEYRDLFRFAGNQKALGEASVRYLYSQQAPVRIKEKLPDVRLIAVLREPVSRLYSHYCMNVQYQLEPLSLSEAIEAESSRRAANWGWDWHYVNVGLYSNQLKRYFDLFDRDQIKVFLYDEFVARPRVVFRDICQHIGLDDQFVPDMSKRGNLASRPKSLTLDRWLRWPNPVRKICERALPRLTGAVISRLKGWNSRPVPPLDKSLREDLIGLFRDDARQLERLLGRKIPWYC